MDFGTLKQSLAAHLIWSNLVPIYLWRALIINSAINRENDQQMFPVCGVCPWWYCPALSSIVLCVCKPGKTEVDQRELDSSISCGVSFLHCPGIWEEISESLNYVCSIVNESPILEMFYDFITCLHYTWATTSPTRASCYYFLNCYVNKERLSAKVMSWGYALSKSQWKREVLI